MVLKSNVIRLSVYSGPRVTNEDYALAFHASPLPGALNWITPSNLWIPYRFISPALINAIKAEIITANAWFFPENDQLSFTIETLYGLTRETEKQIISDNQLKIFSNSAEDVFVRVYYG